MAAEAGAGHHRSEQAFSSQSLARVERSVEAVNVVVGVIAVAATVAWISAFVHGIWALAHLSGKSSLGQMFFSGLRWFDAENYSPRGQQLQRRFLRSFGFFFCCVFGLIMVSALAEGRTPPRHQPLPVP